MPRMRTHQAPNSVRPIFSHKKLVCSVLTLKYRPSFTYEHNKSTKPIRPSLRLFHSVSSTLLSTCETTDTEPRLSLIPFKAYFNTLQAISLIVSICGLWVATIPFIKLNISIFLLVIQVSGTTITLYYLKSTKSKVRTTTNLVMENTHGSMEDVEPLDTRRGLIPAIHDSHQNDPSASNDDDIWGDDESFCNESHEALNKAPDLDREWQRRHNQFHTLGYRDGLTQGKEASAQEGFNSGFKQSVLVGYKWGVVRGVTSALACLPSDLKEMLVELPETRETLHNIHESVHSVSTKDALSGFHADILASESEEQSGCLDGNLHDAKIQSASLLGRYIEEFESVGLGSTRIKLHSAIESQIAG